MVSIILWYIYSSPLTFFGKNHKLVTNESKDPIKVTRFPSRFRTEEKVWLEREISKNTKRVREWQEVDYGLPESITVWGFLNFFSSSFLFIRTSETLPS